MQLPHRSHSPGTFEQSNKSPKRGNVFAGIGYSVWLSDEHVGGARKILSRLLLLFAFLVVSCQALPQTASNQSQSALAEQYHQKARELYRKKDYVGSVPWYRKSADLGNAAAQAGLAFEYANGQGVEKDYKQAYYWWKKAADQGNAEAQFNLGQLYLYGAGVDRDEKQLYFWTKKAADQGYTNGEVQLGLLYFHGWGVDQSFDKAFVLFKKAADQHNHSAENMLAQMYAGELATPTREDPSRTNEWVSYWVNKAAERGDTSAFCDVGLTYAHHIPLPDKNRAIYWLEKGADRGDKYCAKGLQYWVAQSHNGRGLSHSAPQPPRRPPKVRKAVLSMARDRTGCALSPFLTTLIFLYRPTNGKKKRQIAAERMEKEAPWED